MNTPEIMLLNIEVCPYASLAFLPLSAGRGGTQTKFVRGEDA
jgi:hypothetical protein